MTFENKKILPEQLTITIFIESVLFNSSLGYHNSNICFVLFIFGCLNLI